MTYIPINKQPLIFDDQEYCREEFDKCEYLKELNHLQVCRLFKKDNKRKRLKSLDSGISIKCNECKEAWDEAKKQTKMTKIIKIESCFQCAGETPYRNRVMINCPITSMPRQDYESQVIHDDCPLEDYKKHPSEI